VSFSTDARRAGSVRCRTDRAQARAYNSAMRLDNFITRNAEEILVEWEAIAIRLIAPPESVTPLALRDHVAAIVHAIAQDLEDGAARPEPAHKSASFVGIAGSDATAATMRHALDDLKGFDLPRLAAELRALRVSVLRLWLQRCSPDETACYQLARFNEAIDQGLAESIARYSREPGRAHGAGEALSMAELNAIAFDETRRFEARL